MESNDKEISAKKLHEDIDRAIFGNTKTISEFHSLIEEQPAVNRWIPCSERLPEFDTNVLIYYPKWEDAPVQTAHIMLDGTCWEFSDGEFYPSKSEITHWMPLPEIPEPPKEDET